MHPQSPDRTINLPQKYVQRHLYLCSRKSGLYNDGHSFSLIGLILEAILLQLLVVL